MRFPRMIFLVTVLVLAISALAYAGTLVDQGAPGRQGPWPVYCVSESTYRVTKSFITAGITPSSVNGNSSYTTSISTPGSNVGDVCGIVGPNGFDKTDLILYCTAGAGTSTVTIYNTTAGVLTPTAGMYSLAVF